LKKTKKKVGRPRRGSHKFFTKGDLENAVKILRLNAPVPPICFCGELDYVFYLDSRGRLLARCRDTNCRFRRVFSVESSVWGPF